MSGSTLSACKWTQGTCLRTTSVSFVSLGEFLGKSGVEWSVVEWSVVDNRHDEVVGKIRNSVGRKELGRIEGKNNG